VRINAAFASRNCSTANWLNHRVALRVHDDPTDLISSLIGGRSYLAYSLCGIDDLFNGPDANNSIFHQPPTA